MRLTPAQYERVQELFLAARAMEGEARLRYMERACGNDAVLRGEVESLLGTDAPTEDRFLEAPALGEGFHVGDGSSGAPGAGTAREGAGSSADGLEPESMPEQIGPYRLLQKIGEGGFGVVYMAEQTAPVRRRVALKIIKLGMDTERVIGRFEAERQALAMMDHPNIAHVLGAGATDSGRPYFVMDLVEGVPITEYCDEAGLSLRRRLHLFMEVCHAVQHAHQKGIIHRDIKPSNVMIALQDGVPIPKVIDFGIAKATKQRLTERTLFTQCGQFIGTPEYMSPEQAEMSGLDVDTRSDIYSLGVLLYELLTGATPFDSTTLQSASFAELQRIIRDQEPPKPSTRLATMGEAATDMANMRGETPARLSRLLRGELDWIILKALEKDRTRRYETANGFAMDVERYLNDEPVEAGPPSTSYRIRKFVKRNRVGVGAAAVVALALVLLIVGTSLGMGWALRERGRAQRAGESLAATNVELAAQRDEAEHQARLARNVLGYVTGDLIAAVHPDQLGRDATLAEWLDGASQSLEQESTPFVDEPEALISLEHAIGSAYLELSRTDRALEHLERAHEQAVVSLGADNVTTLRVKESLGRALLYPDAPRAASILREALAECRSKHPEEVGLRIDLINALVDALNSEARYLWLPVSLEDGLRLAPEAVALSERAGDQRRLVASLNRLATIEDTAANRRYSPAATRAARRATEISEEAFGAVHVETIRAKRYLAMCLSKRGETREEGMALLDDVAGVAREVFGTDSRIYMMTQEERAVMLRSAGRMAEAAEAYREAAENRARVLGEGHKWTVGMRRSRLWVLRSLGQVAGSLEEMRELLRLTRERYGDSDRWTAWVAESLAAMAEEHGEIEEALWARSFELSTVRRHGVSLCETTIHARRYARLLARLDRRDEAKSLLRSVLGEDPSALKERGELWPAVTTLVEILEQGGADDQAEATRWSGVLDAGWLGAVNRPNATARQLDQLVQQLVEGRGQLERFQRLRNHEIALRLAERSLELTKGSSVASRRLLARALAAAGRSEEAASAWRGLTMLDTVTPPELNIEAWAILMAYPEQRACCDAAVLLAETSIERSERASMVLDTLALAYFRVGRVEDAVVTQREAVANLVGGGAQNDGMRQRLEMFERALEQEGVDGSSAPGG